MHRLRTQFDSSGSVGECRSKVVERVRGLGASTVHGVQQSSVALVRVALGAAGNVTTGTILVLLFATSGIIEVGVGIGVGIGIVGCCSSSRSSSSSSGSLLLLVSLVGGGIVGGSRRLSAIRMGDSRHRPCSSGCRLEHGLAEVERIGVALNGPVSVALMQRLGSLILYRRTDERISIDCSGLCERHQRRTYTKCSNASDIQSPTRCIKH